MKCPNCGFKPQRGRPKKLDDEKVAKLRAKGKSLGEIAEALEVSKGAVQHSVERQKKKK